MAEIPLDLVQVQILASAAQREIEGHFDNSGGDLATALDRIEEIIELCREKQGGSHGE
jgi:hypothetical protein